jgi:Transcriptional regulators
MDRVRNLLEQIKGRLEDLNKAERKVAEIILQNPQQATRFSIAALAQAASVSEPTVNRFCRSFGVSGYPELKLQLAQSLASGAAYVSRAVEADDNPAAYTQKIFGSAIASLDSACQALDPNLISRAVDLLIQARQIHFFWPGCIRSSGAGCATQVLPLQPGRHRPRRRADAAHDRLGGTYR